jgi:thiol-disulfide isomerase/thioredoxin
MLGNMDGDIALPASTEEDISRLKRRMMGLLVALLIGSGAGVALAIVMPDRQAPRRAMATDHTPAAATVDGVAIAMPAYRQEVALYQKLYSGPRAAPGSLAAAAVRQRIEDRAIDQAIGEYLILREARRSHVTAPPRDVSRTLEDLILAAGGTAAARARWGLSVADLRRVAMLQVLNLRLVSVRHDRYWMEHQIDAAAVVYFVGSRAGRSPSHYPAGDPGHPAPSFVAIDLSGHTYALANLAGSPIVLTMWNAACIDCRPELALLAQFAHSHRAVRVVALDEGDSAATIETYLRGIAMTFSIWRDPEGATEDLYDTTGLPCTYFIDRAGIVRDMNIGPMIDMATLDDRAASITSPG